MEMIRAWIKDIEEIMAAAIFFFQEKCRVEQKRLVLEEIWQQVL